MSTATDRIFETPTTGGGLGLSEARRRPSDDSRLLAQQPLSSALPTQDVVVLRVARSMPSVTARSPLSAFTAPMLPDVAHGFLASRDLAQKTSLPRYATYSPILSAPPISYAASVCSPRPLSLPQVRAHMSGATVTSVTLSSVSTRPPTNLSTRGTDISSPSSYSSATTPLSITGYASTPLSTGGRSPLYPAEPVQDAQCPMDMQRLTSREREVFREINARIAALESDLAASRPRSGLDAPMDRNAIVQPESRPFTPVQIPPGFEEGLANYFDGTFNPHSPHRRRRGTRGRTALAEDTDAAASSLESRPLTPIPIPANFEHDIQEYFKASMEPRSPESCRRRAEHREKAATARDREPLASESDDWPSSPETPPLEADEGSNLSNDPIEVIEGVLRAEYEKLRGTTVTSITRRGSSASFVTTSSVGAEYRVDVGMGVQMGRRVRAAPVNVARKMAFDDRQSRSTADERRAMCSTWLLGLEPVGTTLLGRAVVSWP